MTKLQYIQEKFNTEIGKVDILVKVPGRANIIGEHIDYCGASVLPFAISQSMYFAAKQRDDKLIKVKALDLGEEESFQLGQFNKSIGWANYFAQAISIISSKYNLSGLDIYFSSDIPMGAGVSSSSAICVGIITTLNTLFELGLSNDDKIDIASQAEHGIGIRGGVMDQYTILHGKENHALLIDCHNLSHVDIDLFDIPYKWTLLNTNVKHNLVNTPYNDRRSQVEQALKLINERTGTLKTFKEINLSDIKLLSDHPILSKRLQHIHNEISHVYQAVNCIRSKDYVKLGQLLSESHLSLSQDYEVSCTELDFVCAQLLENKNVFGARMMGGGFGGSVIALVDKDFDSQSIKAQYASQFGLELDVIAVNASDGVEIIS